MITRCKLGMNSEEIRCTLESDPTASSMFLGVFPADKIPIVEYKPAAFIANTDPSTMPGQHWVAFFFSENQSEYFDSYGIPPRPDFEVYLKKLGEYKYNDVTLQDFNTTVCGQYCIYFLHFRCQGYTMNEIIDFLNKKPNKNDVLVRDFVKYSPVFNEKCQICIPKCS